MGYGNKDEDIYSEGLVLKGVMAENQKFVCELAVKNDNVFTIYTLTYEYFPSSQNIYIPHGSHTRLVTNFFEVANDTIYFNASYPQNTVQ